MHPWRCLAEDSAGFTQLKLNSASIIYLNMPRRIVKQCMDNIRADQLLLKCTRCGQSQLTLVHMNTAIVFRDREISYRVASNIRSAHKPSAPSGVSNLHPHKLALTMFCLHITGTSLHNHLVKPSHVPGQTMEHQILTIGWIAILLTHPCRVWMSQYRGLGLRVVCGSAVNIFQDRHNQQKIASQVWNHCQCTHG